jgi:hypothetical protein
MKRRIATPVLTTGVLFAVATTGANALPPCSANCSSAGTWFWNKQLAQYSLDVSGIDIRGRHYEVSNADCYGTGANQWGSKGPEFQRYCSVKPTSEDGTPYNTYGLTLYVRGRYAWTWSG